jgi:hypothetical protein
MPEADIDNLLILKKYLLIDKIWGGRKLTDEKHDRSADEIATTFQEAKD